MARSNFYHDDLAWIHHVGFGDFATSAGRELLRILRGGGVTRGTLLDLGCGSGIWARRAQQAGFNVIGVDISPAMLTLARRQAPKSHFHCASLHEFALPPCDAVTALGEGLNYMHGERSQNLPRLFQRIAHALRPGGMLLFDVIIFEGQPMHYRTWRSGPDWAVLTEVSEDRQRRTLTRDNVTFRTVNGCIRRGGERHIVRCFRRADLERALRRAGFAVRTARRYGKLRLAARRLAFIATKPRRLAYPRR